MKIRIGYTWIRYDGAVNSAANYDYQIDSKAVDIKTKKDAIKYLRKWAEEWTGEVFLEVISISESFANSKLDEISDDISGQLIKVSNGKAVFKRSIQS